MSRSKLRGLKQRPFFRKNAIDTANVVMVLIDAVKGFGRQDKSIVDFVIEKGKGLIVYFQ